MIKFQVNTTINFNGSIDHARREELEKEIAEKIKTEIKMKILESTSEYIKDGSVQGFDIQVYQ